ncbi:MAG: hypothetical protein AB1705_19415 [Verrucomicrobiota bacterium]
MIALLVLLGLSLTTAIVLTCLVSYWLRQRTLRGMLPPPPPSERGGLFPRPGFRPALYHQPSRWLAIKSTDLAEVQEAFGLHNPTPCSWEEGLARSQEHKLFIFPPLAGWILVMGSGLPEPDEDIDDFYRFIVGLSRKLGHVQFFSSNRVLYHHAWIRADSGRVLRAYAWAGEVLWNQGMMTPAEIDLGMRCHQYGEHAGGSRLPGSSAGQANAEKVPQLAARWSLDPMAIDERLFRRSQGIAGEPSKSF